MQRAGFVHQIDSVCQIQMKELTDHFLYFSLHTTVVLGYRVKSSESVAEWSGSM